MAAIEVTVVEVTAVEVIAAGVMAVIEVMAAIEIAAAIKVMAEVFLSLGTIGLFVCLVLSYHFLFLFF